MEYNFSVDLEYKNFDLRAFFQGVGSRDFWAYGSVAIPTGGSGFADGAFSHFLDYWTPQNTDAFILIQVITHGLVTGITSCARLATRRIWLI